MMVLHTFAGAAVAAGLLLSATAASADGPGRGRNFDYGSPAVSWSGIYLGIHGGWMGADIGALDAGIFGEGIPAVDTSSVALGFQVGAQRQLGSWVVGLEGGLTSPVANRYSKEDYPTEPANVLKNGIKEIWFVGPRLGYAMGNWMPYVTGGYATTRLDALLIQNGNPLLPYQGRMDGWYLGGGIDWAITRNWTLALDYRRYEFGDKIIIPTFNGAPDPFDAVKFDTKADAVTLRLTYKLGREDHAEPLK
jgi:outer membrane immunogenic protein